MNDTMPFVLSRYVRPTARKGNCTMGKIVRKTSDEIAAMRAGGEIKTDRERIRNLTEEDVERMAMEDPDNFLKTDEDWKQATIYRPGIRGPQKAPTKKPLTIRLSPDVVESFKATGKGWQSRIDDALRTYLKEHPMKHA